MSLTKAVFKKENFKGLLDRQAFFMGSMHRREKKNYLGRF